MRLAMRWCTRFSTGVEEQQGYAEPHRSRILVGNAEWRVPLSGPEWLACFKSRLFFTTVALFADAGVAWYPYTPPYA